MTPEPDQRVPLQEALQPADDSRLTRSGLLPGAQGAGSARGVPDGSTLDGRDRRKGTQDRKNGTQDRKNGTQDRKNGTQDRKNGTQDRKNGTQEPKHARMAQTGEENSDGELLAAFREGDEQGFVSLYRRRHLEIYRYILRFVHGDEDEASDLFQDTFIKIHEHAATLRNGENVRSWMYAIARNNCLNHIKRNRRQVPLDAQHEQIADGEAPDELLHRGAMHGELDLAIQELPDNQREAILLREFEGLSYAEIAEATNTNIGIIRQRLWRAKQTLRMMLSPFFADDTCAKKTQVEDHE